MVETFELGRALELLRAGELVGFPTETVYGLGADATSPTAMRRLYATKGRPADHPVIAHIGDVHQLRELGEHVPEWAERLAGELWPGPLTIVVQRRAGAVCDEVTGGRSTVGVRVPSHPVALALLQAFGRPVAAPSANRFGKVSPTTAQHVRDDLGADVAMVLDGGPCGVGVESTIIDASSDQPRLLRVGAVSVDQLSTRTGLTFTRLDRGEIAAPGTLASHYAPACRVELVGALQVARRVNAIERTGERIGILAHVCDHAAIGMADLVAHHGVVMLDPPTTVDEYAAVLYQRLREADTFGLDRLLVVAPTSEGIGAAVIDRLQRAATVPEQ